MRVLLTGATGYIGGRLGPRLLEAGHEVTVLVRDAKRFAGSARGWADRVRVVEGDLLQPDTLPPAVRDVDVAYYLVHGMGGGRGFAKRDREAANHFIDAARESAELRHVIYLGGLTPEDPQAMTGHLASRVEVGQLLRDGLPTTEFRAGPIIGSGSASFEMVRYLTERLPIMLTPKWVHNRVQPIGVRSVLEYLMAAMDQEPAGVVEIGADVLTFAQMMQRYAKVRGLRRRWIVSLPLLAPTLAGRWVGLVTPIPNNLAVPLIEGVVSPLVADTARAEARFPQVQPMLYEEAVGRALEQTLTNQVQTRWSGITATSDTAELGDEQGVLREVRKVHSAAGPDAVHRAYTSLGGERGYLVWGWAWRLRGFFDQLIGGPGLRRGRRHPHDLHAGEAVDFWRVEEVNAPEAGGDRTGLLRLHAEMKVPGLAWLQFEVEPDPKRGGSCLTQTALFLPKGVLGPLYWYGLYPVHQLIFSQMARAVAKDAERLAHAEGG
jgi:uncharacterized protein YbjT (DUF2867 family)